MKRYLNITLLIMIFCVSFGIITSSAKDNGYIGIGAETINPTSLGMYSTSMHQKQTSKPQYAQKLSCYGVVSDVDRNVKARANGVKDLNTVGKWTDIGQNETKLEGDGLQQASKYYTLDVTLVGVESCRFVGAWRYN